MHNCAQPKKKGRGDSPTRTQKGWRARKINEKCHFNVVWIFSLVSFTFWLHFNCNLPMQQPSLPQSTSQSPSDVDVAAAAVAAAFVVQHACICCRLCCSCRVLHTHVESIHLHPKKNAAKKRGSPNPICHALFCCLFSVGVAIFLTFCFNLWQRQQKG